MKNTKRVYSKIVASINAVIWVICFISLFLVDRARPPFESYLNRIKDMPVRKTWDIESMTYAYYLFISMLILSILSIIFNIIARKKELYRLTITPFFLGICSIYGIIVYLIRF